MTEKAFIQKAKVSNFRTIQSAEVDFFDGINIIIGKNSSGKTSFIEHVYRATNFILSDGYNISESELTIISSNTLKITQKPQIIRDLPSHYPPVIEYDIKYSINDTDKKLTDAELRHPVSIYVNTSTFVRSKIILHGVPDNLWAFTLPESLKGKVSDEKLPLVGIINQSKILSDNFTSFGDDLIIDLITQTKTLDNIQENVLTVINNYCDLFSKVLIKYSPVEKVKLSDIFSVQFDKKNNEILISNIYFEFSINNVWQPFTQLSDGTKRLVYILSEFITTPYRGIYPSTYFIEEPELGIHPHQLNQLMTFLKEESETKQIIITTHSPVVLDILNKDELDRIIISEHTPEKGSTFRHMTEEEKAEAQDYMKDLGYLSYYWRFSDFNRV